MSSDACHINARLMFKQGSCQRNSFAASPRRVFFELPLKKMKVAFPEPPHGRRRGTTDRHSANDAGSVAKPSNIAFRPPPAMPSRARRLSCVPACHPAIDRPTTPHQKAWAPAMVVLFQRSSPASMDEDRPARYSACDYNDPRICVSDMVVSKVAQA